MALDVATFLAPVPGEDPCGPDLAYDGEREKIEIAFHQSQSIDPTGAAVQADGTDWGSVIVSIGQQFARTKDIWLAVYLCRAGANAGRLEVVETGAETLAILLSQHWDGLHPRIEDGDIGLRKTPCDSLGHQPTMLAPLSRVPLVAHPRLGSFGSADLERIRKGGAADADYATLAAVLAELGDDALGEADARFGKIAAAYRNIDAIFAEKSNGRVTPDFAAAYEFFTQTRKVVRSFMKAPAPDPSVADTAAEDGKNAGPSLSGAVRSREDVTRVLEIICEYYRQYEPSSPVPLLLERAKAWVALPFLQVLADIAPGAMNEAKGVLTIREKKP